MKRIPPFLCALAAVTLWAANVAAAPIELITNGDFETGSLAGWTVTNVATGDFLFDTPGTTTPLSAHATLATAANGIGYAVSDQSGPGVHALSQLFTVAPGASSVILSFDMFANDWDSGPICGPGLTISAGVVQCARVDILSSAAGLLDTGAGVLANYFLGVDGGPDPHGFTSYLFDITALVGGGGTFRLRFAEADNQGFFNLGVDNVSVRAVPEPVTLLLVGAGLAGFGLRRRTRA